MWCTWQHRGVSARRGRLLGQYPLSVEFMDYLSDIAVFYENSASQTLSHLNRSSPANCTNRFNSAANRKTNEQIKNSLWITLMSVYLFLKSHSLLVFFHSYRLLAHVTARIADTARFLAIARQLSTCPPTLRYCYQTGSSLRCPWNPLDEILLLYL